MLKYCQGTRCHEYTTQNRIRGTKGNKTYQTRRASQFYYAENFCTLNCMYDWLREYGDKAIDYFGRTTEPMKRIKTE